MNSDLMIYVISFLAFMCVLALVEGLYQMWGSLNVERKVKVRRRLRHLSAAGVSSKEAVSLLRNPKISDNPVLNRIMLRVPRFHVVDRVLDQAGLDLTVSRYMGIQILLSAVLLVLLRVFTPGHILVLILVSVVVGFGLPALYVRRKREERIAMFTRLLPDAMDYIARSMRAGNPFSASLKGASEQMPEPMASELGTTFDELNFGLDLDAALQNLCERTGSEELRYFVTAVLIQHTTGGNLAEVLGRIATVMRSRSATVREIIVLATEMKYSANVLIALPFFMAALISIVNPDYLAELTKSPIGIKLIMLQITMMAIGYYVVQKMIHFKV